MEENVLQPETTSPAGEDFKARAIEKLKEELGKAKDKKFADPVIGYLLKRCEEDNGLAQDVMQEHKTWDKCYSYIYDQAKKQATGNRAAVRGDVVYEWAEDYYHKDDKKEEEEKAEREKRQAELRKKSEEQRKENLAKDWVEYIGWCTELKYDLNNLFIYLPKNFKKVHDRTAEEYQALQDKKKAAEKKRRDRQARKEMAKTKAFLEDILSENEENADAFSIKGKGLVLVVPKDAQDIRREGEILHHCVGTYIERVARGETSIFFVRKEKEPEKPYYTMEWKNDQVYQCRGLRNAGMTPKVKAFTQAFEKIMHDAESRKAEQREAVRVRV